MVNKNSRPLATRFSASTKRQVQEIAAEIAHFSDRMNLAAQNTEPWAYSVADTKIYPDGTVAWGEHLPVSDISYITRYLETDRGYTAEIIDRFPVTIRIEENRLILEREWWASRHITNIKHQIAEKTNLLAAILCIDETRVLPETRGNKIVLNWLAQDTDEELQGALVQLLARICAHAATSRRLQALSKATGNPKYVMRCCLLRLGFNGSEHKHARAMLLKPLEGNAAWRTRAEKGQ